MINIGLNFRILKNFRPNPRCAPLGYLSGNLFHKPDLIALSQLLIHVGYTLGIQNIYSLPMSGSHLLGAIWLGRQIFVQFFCRKFRKNGYFWPPEVPKKGRNLKIWAWNGSKSTIFIFLWFIQHKKLETSTDNSIEFEFSW